MTVKWLRTGRTSGSDTGGVLQRNNIGIRVASECEAGAALVALNAGLETVWKGDELARVFRIPTMAVGDRLVGLGGIAVVRRPGDAGPTLDPRTVLSTGNFSVYTGFSSALKYA